MSNIELDREQSRQVCFSYIIDTMIMDKQYLDDSAIRKYKFMLNEVGTLIELEKAIERFNKAWPIDVRWDLI